MLEIEFVERTDVGRVRDHNEDYLGHASASSPELARKRGWLFVLADGVGGHEKGEVASRTAVESMIDGFQKAKDGEAHMVLLPRLVQQANTHIIETAMAGGRESAGMATTLVACALRFDRGRRSSCGRFALLFDAQKSSRAAYARSHRLQ